MAQNDNPQSLYMISREEMRLLQRLRTLQSGAHLVIIQTDGAGLYALTVLDSGKLERLRKTGEQAEQSSGG
jgi:hypothetical protein